MQLASRFASHSPALRSDYPLSDDQIRSRDLFAEDDAGVYLTDAALLVERLAQDKLAGIAAAVRVEGWAWVDATPGVTHADLRAFQRAPKERREPNKREALRIEKLQAKMLELAEAVDAALDADDEEKADALQEEGEAVVHRGLMREAEAKALRTLERLRQGFGSEDAGTTTKARTETAKGSPRLPPYPTGWPSA